MNYKVRIINSQGKYEIVDLKAPNDNQAINLGIEIYKKLKGKNYEIWNVTKKRQVLEF